MRIRLVTMVLTGWAVCILNCTGESIGRKIDPDYDAYINNRTPQQKMKDEEDKEKVQANQNATKSDSKFENDLDSKFDSMAREQRQKDQGK